MSEFDKEFEKVSGVKFPLGSGYYSAFSCGCEAGQQSQQSQQAKIDELQARIDKALHAADESCGVSVAAFVKLNNILKAVEK